jgi:hypothetical protein
LTNFDSSGNLLSSTLILDSLNDKLAVDKHWGKIIKTSDGGYAMTAAPFIRNSAVLIKVNHDLEVEFIKEYEDTVNLSNYRYKLTEIEDGYLLYGAIQRPNFKDNPFIRRVDKFGNTVWFKYFGDYNTAGAFQELVIINDSTIVGSATQILSGNKGQSIIYISDLEGNIIKSWFSEPEPEVGYFRHIVTTTDGGFITLGEYLVEIVFDTKILQATLAKFDSELQVKWVKHYGLPVPYYADVIFWDIEPTTDGNYIGAGESFIIENPNDTVFNAGWLMKFSPDGDSIWSRYDLPPLSISAHMFNDQYFDGVGVLSSGSIIAGGSAGENNERYIWLVKVTTDGCLDTLFCGLVPIREPMKSTATEVYPNPANTSVSVALPAAAGEAVLVLYDVQGKPVRRQERLDLAAVATIETRDLSPGIYFLEIRLADGRTERRKLLILH